MPGLTPHNPGAWEGDGIDDDPELVEDAITTFGFLPAELQLLADWSANEQRIWEMMAKDSQKPEDREACGNYAAYFQRRARRLQAIAAHDDIEEEDGSSDDLPDR